MKTYLYLTLITLISLLVSCSTTLKNDSVTFQHQEIDPTPPKNPWIKIIGDINNDNLPDIIIGGQKGPLVWYENPSWNKTIISEGGYYSVEGAVGDIDGDGDLDVALGGTFWYENPEIGNDSLNGQWLTHNVDDYRGHDIQLDDLNMDGKLDIAVRNQSGFGHNAGNKVILYLQISPDEWEREEINCPHGEGLKLADLDKDNFPDVIVGSQWYKNPAQNETNNWQEFIISTLWNYQDTRIEVADYNNDGRLDVCLAPSEPKGGSYKLAWYEAPENFSKSENWVEDIIEEPVETVVHTLDAADMNGDGSLDIIAASMHQGAEPREVRVYLNNGPGKEWKKQVVSTTGSHEAIAVDLDGDGAMDIIGANWSGPYQALECWRNSSISK